MIVLPTIEVIPPRAIIAATELAYGLPTGGLRKNYGKPALIASARQVAMYLIRANTNYSLPKIGREFGGYHHTTVLHSIRQVTAALGAQEGLQATVDRIRANAEKMAVNSSRERARQQ